MHARAANVKGHTDVSLVGETLAKRKLVLTQMIPIVGGEEVAFLPPVTGG